MLLLILLTYIHYCTSPVCQNTPLNTGKTIRLYSWAFFRDNYNNVILKSSKSYKQHVRNNKSKAVYWMVLFPLYIHEYCTSSKPLGKLDIQCKYWGEGEGSSIAPTCICSHFVMTTTDLQSTYCM